MHNHKENCGARSEFVFARDSTKRRYVFSRSYLMTIVSETFVTRISKNNVTIVSETFVTQISESSATIVSEMFVTWVYENNVTIVSETCNSSYMKNSERLLAVRIVKINPSAIRARARAEGKEQSGGGGEQGDRCRNPLLLPLLLCRPGWLSPKQLNAYHKKAPAISIFYF